MRFRLLSFLLLLITARLLGQEYRYVNTDNLILRDRPENIYNVYAILHAPCKVLMEQYEDGYKTNKAVTGKFYQVSISFDDDNGIHHYISGWVVKKYLVSSIDKVTQPGADKSKEIVASEVDLIPYAGNGRFDPNNGNARKFQLPVYKGGEKQPGPVKRVYHTGPRGGCYYLGSKGTKVYVDSKWCKDGQSKK